MAGSVKHGEKPSCACLREPARPARPPKAQVAVGVALAALERLRVLQLVMAAGFNYYARTSSLIEHPDQGPDGQLWRAAQRIDMSNTAATLSAGRPTRARLLILVLLTIGTLINYLDRTVISVAAPLMSKDLGLNAAVMGLVFSAFSWTYAAAQIPGGILIDRLGVRLTYFLSVTVWSAFTLLQGLTTGLWSLLACRLGLGVAAFSSSSACRRSRSIPPPWSTMLCCARQRARDCQ